MKNSAMIEALKIASDHIKYLGEQSEEQMLGLSEDDVTDTVHLAFYQIADLLEQAANQKRSPLFKELEIFTAGKSLSQHQLEAIWYAKCAIFLLVDELGYSLNAACKKVSQYMGATHSFMRDKMPPKANYDDLKNSAEYADMRKAIGFALQKNDADDADKITKKAIQDFAFEAMTLFHTDKDGYLSQKAFDLTTGAMDENTSSFFEGIN